MNTISSPGEGDSSRNRVFKKQSSTRARALHDVNKFRPERHNLALSQVATAHFCHQRLSTFIINLTRVNSATGGIGPCSSNPILP